MSAKTFLEMVPPFLTMVALLALASGVVLWRAVVVHWTEPHPGRVGGGAKVADAPDDLQPIPEEVQPELPANEGSLLGLIELILKAPRRADALARDEQRLGEILPRFLGIALGSYAIFALVLALILNLASAAAWPVQPLLVPPASWSDGTALAPLLAYTLVLVAASGLCLPSFYFFGLLAGVRLSWVQVIGLVSRCQAASAVVLLGILPIYVALALGLIVFQAEPSLIQLVRNIGLVLPFIAGLQGVVSIYQGVMGLAETQPTRCQERACFMRRLTLGWSACYTLVAPVMVYRLWEFFAEKLA
jgi:hypothetical protein